MAEEILGKAVEGRRQDFILATKVGMKVGNNPEDEDTSPEAIRIQLRRSLKRMNTDYIDIYYLHRYDPHTDPHDIARAIGDELKDPCMGTTCAAKSRELAHYYKIKADLLGCHFLDANGCEFNKIDFMHLTRNGHAQLAEKLAALIPSLL
mgnify:CR=1 FL=1